MKHIVIFFPLSSFNSIKVRLILQKWKEISISGKRFNSIKVRLILAQSFIRQGWKMFQFHKGSINTAVWVMSLKRLISFNSIKVRLIQRGFLPNSDFSLFQFHKGSINTTNPFLVKWTADSFNSIKVRLIPYNLKDQTKSPNCFNSIKVRLIQIAVML